MPTDEKKSKTDEQNLTEVLQGITEQTTITNSLGNGSKLASILNTYGNSIDAEFNLYINSNKITSIALSGLGLKYFPVLVSQTLINLNLNKNDLTNIDVSQLPNLTRLWIDKTKIEHLSLLKNPHLTNMKIGNNTKVDYPPNMAPKQLKVNGKPFERSPIHTSTEDTYIDNESSSDEAIDWNEIVAKLGAIGDEIQEFFQDQIVENTDISKTLDFALLALDKTPLKKIVQLFRILSYTEEFTQILVKVIGEALFEAINRNAYKNTKNYLSGNKKKSIFDRLEKVGMQNKQKYEILIVLQQEISKHYQIKGWDKIASVNLSYAAAKDEEIKKFVTTHNEVNSLINALNQKKSKTTSVLLQTDEIQDSKTNELSNNENDSSIRETEEERIITAVRQLNLDHDLVINAKQFLENLFFPYSNGLEGLTHPPYNALKVFEAVIDRFSSMYAEVMENNSFSYQERSLWQYCIIITGTVALALLRYDDDTQEKWADAIVPLFQKNMKAWIKGYINFLSSKDLSTELSKKTTTLFVHILYLIFRTKKIEYNMFEIILNTEIRELTVKSLGSISFYTDSETDHLSKMQSFGSVYRMLVAKLLLSLPKSTSSDFNIYAHLEATFLEQVLIDLKPDSPFAVSVDHSSIKVVAKSVKVFTGVCKIVWEKLVESQNDIEPLVKLFSTANTVGQFIEELRTEDLEERIQEQSKSEAQQLLELSDKIDEEIQEYDDEEKQQLEPSIVTSEIPSKKFSSDDDESNNNNDNEVITIRGTKKTKDSEKKWTTINSRIWELYQELLESSEAKRLEKVNTLNWLIRLENGELNDKSIVFAAFLVASNVRKIRSTSGASVFARVVTIVDDLLQAYEATQEENEILGYTIKYLSNVFWKNHEKSGSGLKHSAANCIQRIEDKVLQLSGNSSFPISDDVFLSLTIHLLKSDKYDPQLFNVVNVKTEDVNVLIIRCGFSLYLGTDSRAQIDQLLKYSDILPQDKLILKVFKAYSLLQNRDTTNAQKVLGEALFENPKAINKNVNHMVTALNKKDLKQASKCLATIIHDRYIGQPRFLSQAYWEQHKPKNESNNENDEDTVSKYEKGYSIEGYDKHNTFHTKAQKELASSPTVRLKDATVSSLFAQYNNKRVLVNLSNITGMRKLKSDKYHLYEYQLAKSEFRLFFMVVDNEFQLIHADKKGTHKVASGSYVDTVLAPAMNRRKKYNSDQASKK